jgi:hypothetical protein
MNARSVRKPVLAGVVAVILLAALGLVKTPDTQASAVARLHVPSFVSNANVTSKDDIGTLLDEEAGISAYFKSPDAINLSQVRAQFRTIEDETGDYIIGSVAVPGYYESADPHVYVHRDGWILAYYKRLHPVGKIVDADAYSITNTKLKTVVAAVAGAAGAAFADVEYYDFRYPNATHMMLVAEDSGDGNYFTIQLPSTFGYFERGWAVRTSWNGLGWCEIDGVSLPSDYWDSGTNRYGTIAAAELLPDVQHTVSVEYNGEWVALVILYRVP